MGITATIQNIPGGKKVILIAVSVGAKYYQPEYFSALAEAVLDNVGNGLINPDTPCVILRGCLAQRHTLEFKYNLTPEQALSYALYTGEEWEKDCQIPLNRLRATFKNFTMIRWGGDKKVLSADNDIYSQNENFVIRQLPGRVECLGHDLPKFELKLTPTYFESLGKFNADLNKPENEDLKGLAVTAVNLYCAKFISSLMGDNMDLVITPTQIEKIRAQSEKYVAEDVIELNQTIELVLETFKLVGEDLSILFTYPFPHGKVEENATMHLLTNRKIMRPEVRFHLKFPKLFINPGYPVLKGEDRKKAREERKAQKEESKYKAVVRRLTKVEQHGPNNSGTNEEAHNKSSSEGNSPVGDSPLSVSPRSIPVTPTDTSPTDSPNEDEVGPKKEKEPRKLPSSSSTAETIIPDKKEAGQTDTGTRTKEAPPQVSRASAGSSSIDETDQKKAAQSSAANTYTPNVGLFTGFFIYKNASRGNAPPLNDDELLKEMEELARKSKTLIPGLSMAFPNYDSDTINKMALFYTISQSAMNAVERNADLSSETATNAFKTNRNVTL